ncbi:daptide-type RiPP [Rathayibacter iranicus]|uniref:Lactobin A/cerein 7B family class IIb bacteriocin n=1 Tax=Rathayibacter iranicus NCPPB 2253 = VKM Ac-1602 TaxID=1328868 RepID=A0ABX5LGZ7_9MICO|nr:daptide-type RiPP [Rathayibacter iranicus]MWV29902.1 hypothetical protein [Rathayibacter iranicus NCPPB 2253 = VKM Ac-1602]PWJ66992.1 hypothetical protein B0H03_101454 [Rathayibacter iranicus NCPPB 2253 = VKM Ac-1602]
MKSVTASEILKDSFVELEVMDAPSDDSWWQGLLGGIGVIGTVAIIAT